MIIQCEQCFTKFKLDDSKVTDKGVKVRCAKCKHVFTVHKDQEHEKPAVAFEEMLDTSVNAGSAFLQNDSGVAPVLSSPSATVAEQSVVDEQTVAFDDSAFEMSPSVSKTPETVAGDDFNLSALEDGDGFSKDATDDVDFGAFDFGDASEDADKTVVAPTGISFGDETVVQQKTVKDSDDFGGLDFSGDSMFGEVVPQTPEESAADISFDLQMNDFAASMGVEDSISKRNETISASDVSEAPFSLGEIDFGDELTSVAVQQVNPDELKPGQDLLFAPMLETHAPVSDILGDDTLRSDVASGVASPPDELPPLSISTRRKQGAMPAILAGVGVLLVAALAFFGYSSLTSDKTVAPKESGRIAIRSVDASFIKNKTIGELLVIKGEAVNEYATPRGAIQVKGMIYGGKGEVLVSKTAFGGNPLTPEQLSTITLEALEAAMANQFGDSLTNMEVAPGKSVPFVVVLVKPAAEAKDYGVEPAGSTEAAAK